MNKWRDCVVVLVDLTGVKKKAPAGGPRASARMRELHKLVRKEMPDQGGVLRHAYVWNDAVLFFAYVDNSAEKYEQALRAVDGLKRKIDGIDRSYAIAVKGKVFPSGQEPDNSRVTVIKASSWAMANCFEIEKEAKRQKLRSAWYVDERIANKVNAARAGRSFQMPFLPNGSCRKVYWHRDYLWPLS